MLVVQDFRLLKPGACNGVCVDNIKYLGSGGLPTVFEVVQDFFHRPTRHAHSVLQSIMFLTGVVSAACLPVGRLACPVLRALS